MKKLFFLLLLFIYPAFTIQSKAQSKEPENTRTKKEQQAFDAQEQKRIKSEEAGRKRHQKIQTKKTRKRMKESKKKSRRVNEPKKEFFLFRLFKK
ncbi:MAG TPA: hypothetical protein PK323_08920 [Bacteroidia bacterium]|nr:hypothetical protein [Bacteroidia bacterium]